MISIAEPYASISFGCLILGWTLLRLAARERIDDGGWQTQLLKAGTWTTRGRVLRRVGITSLAVAVTSGFLAQAIPLVEWFPPPASELRRYLFLLFITLSFVLLVASLVPETIASDLHRRSEHRPTGNRWPGWARRPHLSPAGLRYRRYSLTLAIVAAASFLVGLLARTGVIL